ncbi:alpha/beta-hydrolase family protein [Bosea sp. (in: a-proteobacteria)]|uniref:alpha/beta hydrolase n=1 Tax=Bosea sp. (in: a-proteobacteria) TaxID=1871050 RepID=UPI00263501A2|nr:alpha/beta-hydrolase family protein [Bosea sp. (in: a-proteobacteria)]MCO5091063.1 alpha/beta-hydrolase family protein [Bosea sp. (in: a-proteobacteria)]
MIRQLPLLPLRWVRNLSGLGLVLGTFLFAASLTPTLVPRTAMTQGVLAGVCFAVGYGLGTACNWLWAYLEMPKASERVRRIGNIAALCICLPVVVIFLAKTTEWQNSIRAVMAMEPITSALPIQISLIALISFAALLMLGRLFGFVTRFLAQRLLRFMPRRVALVAGLTITTVLVWTLSNGFLVRITFHVLDSSFRARDALIEPASPQPADPLQSGSSASLVKWQELGRAGREFVAARPAAAEITALTGRPALQPIRLYVGLRAADTAEERARLALEEMKRVGAFERAILVVITPTGTGWVDPSAISPIEYLADGDIASVALQYSYLSSPLSLLAQPEHGSEAARALFVEVYRYWTGLPRERRPRLYLHGLSLGAMNSERSVELLDMIGDPVDGALWSGPPFGSRIWRGIMDRRNPGSPAWLPVYRDSRFVRFMNQDGPSVPPETPWGIMRVVYLQYASDAVTFFDQNAFFRPPPWLSPVRGRDVSPEFRWYPIVTGLQLALDMAVATQIPMGYGHVYAPQHYVEAWVAVAGIQTWPQQQIAALKRLLRERAGQGTGDAEGKESAYHNRGG